MGSFTVGFYTCWNFNGTELEDQIFATNSSGLNIKSIVAKNESEFFSFLGDIDGLIMANEATITKEVAEKLAPRCRVIARQGVGVDNINLAACKQVGIAVANVPDYCLEEVSDHALALALSLVRQTNCYTKMVISGAWDVLALPPHITLNRMTLGLCGFGRISKTLARKAGGIFARLVSYDPVFDQKKASELGVTGVNSFEDLIRQSDILSLHVPGNPENRHLINRESLSWFKPTAILVNTARGSIIDEEALYQSLVENKLAAAGLDVLEKEPPTNNPLFSLPNVILTPHSAWYSQHASEESRTRAAQEVIRGISGIPLKNLVNP